jgi:D-sedoheptulose 7-phosphate isomerase
MNSFQNILTDHLSAHHAATARLGECQAQLDDITSAVIDALHQGNKIIFFGNGGSAADAQHLAAEFVIRYRTNRRSLPAMALTTDTSMLTACGNDFGFETIFARQLEGLANEGDIAIGISTSGNSANVIAGLVAAKIKGCLTIAFTNEAGGTCAEIADLAFCAPSLITAHAQECHMIIGHAICEMVDQAFGE